MTKTATPIAAQAGLREIDKLIKAASAAYGSAQGKVQVAALAIMSHAIDFGDCSRAKVLCRAVPARERNSLIGWFQMFSPIGVQMGKTAADDACRFIKKESKNFNDFDIEAARAHPWHEDPANANPEPKALNTLADFWSTVDAIFAKAIKDAGKDKYTATDADVVKDQAQKVRAMINTYRAKVAAASNDAIAEKHNNQADEAKAKAEGVELPVGVEAAA